ncbi:hypothetical protein JVT61DRAFT_1735 [Boletus reticuloceps]|uniref:Fungal-type protein kinase domain-containing protein n=1 Tax=Boletus reticuloceps TaxID=495285 RepID=A0A8I2YTZ7_9AGAM|nr:hypothetical protein JVT61DRAFT_1735 [Boletus reticuloceps]
MAPYTTNAKYRVKEMTQMGKEMRDYMVGPMPAQRFLGEFFPTEKLEAYTETPFTPGTFRNTVACRNERLAYRSFVNSAEKLAPELAFVDSSGHSDSSRRTNFSLHVKPDVCVYSRGAVLVEGDDPFCFLRRNKEGLQHKKFLRESKAALDTLAQTTAYASAQLGSQFRAHCYSVLIVKKVARVVRWDRSGAIVTTPIAHNTEGELAEFMCRFSKAAPAMRGVDETVTIPPVSDASEAPKCLNLPDDVPMFQTEVCSLFSDENLRVIAPAPIAPHYSPPGRATRGFVAYYPARKKKVFLKDTWRVDVVGIEQEGDIYKLLPEKQVRNVPQCIAARLKSHRHYRLVLDDVGVKLMEFRSSRELVQAVSDALDAHEDAVKKSLVLHWDISPGNIIIVNGRGMLIDWDLCKLISSKEDGGPQRSTCTGTWQFMSGALVYFMDAQHTIEDDLESIFYVLLWVAIMYLPSTLTPARRTVFINHTFDPWPIGGCGGDYKIMFLKWPHILHTMRFTDGAGEVNREALKDLCIGLATQLAGRYSLGVDWKSCTSGPKATHDALSLLFGTALEAEGWPDGDRSSLQKLVLNTEDGHEAPYRVAKNDWETEVDCPKSTKRQRIGGNGDSSSNVTGGRVNTSEDEDEDDYITEPDSY